MSTDDGVRRLLDRHQTDALSSGVRIPDTEDELNWHAFLGHHDFWRFRGDLFFLDGRGSFAPLRKREPPVGLELLAEVWRQLEATDPGGVRGKALLARYRSSRATPTPKENLRSDLAVAGAEAREFLTIWDEFRNGTARCYACILHDAAVLVDRFSSSFRTYLEATAEALMGPRGDGQFPNVDWAAAVGAGCDRPASLEDGLAQQITCDFGVGLEVARYLLCDWLLELWHKGRVPIFLSYKHDENAVNFGKCQGWYSDRASFLQVCAQHTPGLPPRVLNECIWLHQNARNCDCLPQP